MDDLKCEQVVEMLTDYLDEALPPGEMDALREHLSTCDGCSAYLDQIRRAIAAARGRRESADVDEETEASVLELFHNWVNKGGAGETR